MLYYNKIGNFEGVDYSEGQDCVGDATLESTQCICCLFYFYRKRNFQYERYICNGCYQCMQYEKADSRMLFRVAHTEKRTFRTVSDYILMEIEELLLKNDFNDRFGWLYKSESKTPAMPASNEVPIGSSRGIEPRPLD